MNENSKKMVRFNETELSIIWKLFTIGELQQKYLNLIHQRFNSL